MIYFNLFIHLLKLAQSNRDTLIKANYTKYSSHINATKKFEFK